MLTDSVPHNHIAIIGTGFGRSPTAVRLQQAGFDDFVLIDRAGDVGGVWRDNSYPGAAVDVKSHLYSLSFAPNPDWRTSSPSRPNCSIHWPCYGPVRPPAPARAWLRSRGAALGWERAVLAARDRARPADRTARCGRDRCACRARHPRPAGVEELQGRAVSLGPLGPRLRSDRKATRSHRHGRIRNPVRAGDPARCRSHDGVPADAAVDDAAPTIARSRPGRGSSFVRSPSCSGWRGLASTFSSSG